MGSQNATKRRKWFKWYHLYYFLAALDVLTITASILLNHTVLGIYMESVEKNAVWSNRVSHYSTFNELAAAVNAPGNDAFDSGDIVGERKRLSTAYDAFRVATATARDDLRLQESDQVLADLLRHLDLIEKQVAQIHVEATAVFEGLEKNKLEEAGARMAEMDRCFSRSLGRIGELCESVRRIQSSRFDEETARAHFFSRFELALAGIVCLILCVVTWYGHKMAKVMRQNETRIRTSEQQVNAIVNTAADPIITITSCGDIKSFNPAAERLFGYAKEEVIGGSVKTLMPSCYQKEYDNHVAQY